MRLPMIVTTMLLTMALGVAHAATPPHSGFLETYPKMHPDPKRPGASIYIAPGTSLKGLARVRIDPILIWYAKDSQYQGIDPNELAAVTNNFRRALTKHLEPRFPVVDTAGPDVLELRIALTNVVAEEKKRGILGYTPVGFVIGAVNDAATAGPNLNIRSATVEAELLDANGKQLAVVVDPLVTDGTNTMALSWSDIAKIMDDAGKRLRARMDGDNPQ